MKINIFRLLSWCISTLIFAGFAYAQQTVGVGQVAENMLEPVSVLSDFVYTACFAVGGAFLFAAIIKYFEHRRSPLMVPISTVVFLVIFAIVLISLPFLSWVTGSGFKYSLFQ